MTRQRGMTVVAVVMMSPWAKGKAWKVMVALAPAASPPRFAVTVSPERVKVPWVVATPLFSEFCGIVIMATTLEAAVGPLFVTTVV